MAFISESDTPENTKSSADGPGNSKIEDGGRISFCPRGNSVLCSVKKMLKNKKVKVLSKQ